MEDFGFQMMLKETSYGRFVLDYYLPLLYIFLKIENSLFIIYDELWTNNHL